MRVVYILLAAGCLLCGFAMAAPALQLTATVGFDGYYRTGTLVPIALQIQNTGDPMDGEFRVTTPKTPESLTDTYRFPLFIHQGANQRRFLYVLPHTFSRDFSIEYWSKGNLLVRVDVTNGKELYDTDRLVAVLGGTGSSLSFVNSQGIAVTEGNIPRPWAFSGNQNRYPYRGGYVPPTPPSGPGNANSVNGNIRLVNLRPDLLPDNPEAYGSLSVLALMSDVTENTLSSGDVRDAISMWIANGGHLLVAGGGVPARLNAPFFTTLLPIRDGKPVPGAETVTNADGGRAVTAPLGTGRVTALSYDPDMSATTSAFLGKLIARDPSSPFTTALNEVMNSAVMPRNLKAPNLNLIFCFLLLYLVLLVPVNYFVLKKMDKRELAWLTTPAIVLIFTLGAYGIGKLTKGSRLLLNSVSIVETAARQPVAEAVSNLLIFSPSRTAYTLALGDTGLLACETAANSNDASGRQSSSNSPLTLRIASNAINVERININMWDFRQFTMAHKLAMGKGFSANLAVSKQQVGMQPAPPPPPPGGPPASMGSQPPQVPRYATAVTGTITNGTPYRYAICELYYNSSLVGKFTMDAGQTVKVLSPGMGAPHPAVSEDENHMLTALQTEITNRFTTTSLGKGFTLVAYSADAKARPPIQISGRAPALGLTVMAVHL